MGIRYVVIIVCLVVVLFSTAETAWSAEFSYQKIGSIHGLIDAERNFKGFLADQMSPTVAGWMGYCVCKKNRNTIFFMSVPFRLNADSDMRIRSELIRRIHGLAGRCGGCAGKIVTKPVRYPYR